MIRINLLSVEKPIAATASSGRSSRSTSSDKAGPIAALFVLAGCAGYIALDYLSLQQQDAALHQELIAARAEKAAPAADPARGRALRGAARRELQQRVNLIEELRQQPGRAGPHARSDQPQHARIACGCTDMKQTGQRRHARRQDQHAVVAGRLRRQPRGLGLLRQARSRSSTAKKRRPTTPT